MNIYSNLCLSTNQSLGDEIVTREQFSECVIRKPNFFPLVSHILSFYWRRLTKFRSGPKRLRQLTP
jgi:hypothetical protein